LALEDNVIQSQKYTSFRRLQLFLNAFVPLASTRSPNPARPAALTHFGHGLPSGNALGAHLISYQIADFGGKVSAPEGAGNTPPRFYAPFGSEAAVWPIATRAQRLGACPKSAP
jgi:hypothetical protein